MTSVPANPKIYHITHINNLPAIIDAGELLSDARMLANDSGCTVVGMSDIKRRRLEEIEVPCHSGTHVGEYVPFYFCPRSIMLYILHMRNHPNLSYRGGQEPIIHLQADLASAIAWADTNGRPWAVSDRNAGSFTADFCCQVECFNLLDWDAISATDFRDIKVREGKQAEFLMHGSFPWGLVEHIGVCDDIRRCQAAQAIAAAKHKPLVTIERGWYY
jgi:hypothetical protein